ncbi:hypothetical protein GLW07_09445 [Bacillus hwajinpoensis]|uniref:Uncharacterized protein n=1 Tax=Guptibacillus hwajinpoensis TaxID=208199 RepID=A0A845EYJ9_9BACL|nr:MULTISPECIES: hypothetical protein [Bacillaceae]MYL63576.1 hypothetical protein [Pseudalkalibacillus hwajinpoensis]PFG12756.1 hypothetical protein ATG70_0943 [Bacillus sp. es.036]
MKKKDIQALYKEVKRRRRSGLQETTQPTIKKPGCKSCGKVTWKPNNDQ